MERLYNACQVRCEEVVNSARACGARTCHMRAERDAKREHFASARSRMKIVVLQPSFPNRDRKPVNTVRKSQSLGTLLIVR